MTAREKTCSVGRAPDRTCVGGGFVALALLALSFPLARARFARLRGL